MRFSGDFIDNYKEVKVVCPVIIQLAQASSINTTPPKEEKKSLSAAEIVNKYALSSDLTSQKEIEKAYGEYFDSSKKLVIVIPECHNLPNPIKELYDFSYNEFQLLKKLKNQKLNFLLVEGRLKGKGYNDFCLKNPQNENSLPKALNSGLPAWSAFDCIYDREVTTLGYSDLDLMTKEFAFQALYFAVYTSMNPKLINDKKFMFIKINIDGFLSEHPEQKKALIEYKNELQSKYIIKHKGNKISFDEKNFWADEKALLNQRSIKGTKNALEIMSKNKQKIAVMITGSAHADLTIKTLKENKVSYIVLEPKGLKILRKIYPPE